MLSLEQLYTDTDTNDNDASNDDDTNNDRQIIIAVSLVCMPNEPKRSTVLFNIGCQWSVVV